MSMPFARDGVIFYPYDGIWAAVSWTSNEVVFLRRADDASVENALAKLHPVHEDLPPPWRGLCLYITTRCNLACVYCYARGGETRETMPWNVARTALDYYLRQNDGNLSVTFHGAGEPTLEYSLIRRCCEHVESRLTRGRSVRYSIVTNGVVGDSVLNWLIRKKFRFSISLDGIPTVQDAQRPLRGGGRSSPFVERTVKAVVASGLPYSVNAVFTSKTYGAMVDSAKYFAGLGVRYARLRHAFICGRCHQNDLRDLDMREYLRNLREAKRAAAALGVKIAIPGYNMPFPHHCGIATGYFAGVSHQGFVTGCTEVTARSHPAHRTFHMGEVDVAARTVRLDQAKLKRHRERSWAAMPACQACVMRDYCNGGCMIRCWEHSGQTDAPDPSECQRSKELFLSYIREIVEATLKRHCDRRASPNSRGGIHAQEPEQEGRVRQGGQARRPKQVRDSS